MAARLSEASGFATAPAGRTSSAASTMTAERVFIPLSTPDEDRGSRVMREPFEAEGVVMGSATRADLHPRLGLPQSRRLLGLAGDARLAQQIRRGSDTAFEVAFERHAGPILGFCRHMLGSQEEAEDAVQQTFAAAYADLQRGGEREIALKAWLFAIARNRC